MPDPNATPLRLRIICLNPPTTPGTVFGLQDKSGDLLPGQPRGEDALAFECDVTAKPSEGDMPNLSGVYVHGKPGERFLYLSLAPDGIAPREWIRRIKVPLKAITWDHVTAAAAGLLEASVDGTRSGTVKLLGDGWQVRPRGS